MKKRRLNTSTARARLPELVKAAARRRRAGRSLVANAIEIGPYGRGGALLIPEIDAQAAMERENQLSRRVEKLEDELEAIGIALFLQERIAESSGETMSAEDFLRELGFEDRIERLPLRR